MREKYVEHLSSVLETRETYSSNLESCESAKAHLLALVKRDYSGTDGDLLRLCNVFRSFEFSSDIFNLYFILLLLFLDQLNGDPSQSSEFDHSSCKDCSYGCTISSDCAKHMVALRQQVIDANSRLQSLVEVRERVMEIASDLDLGDENGSHSNLSDISVDP